VKRRVTVIIPALNEEATVAGVVRGCLEALPPDRFDVSVLVVDDGSTDRTADVAREAGAVVVSHPSNMGVGRAFQTGLDRALAGGPDLIVSIDADGQFDPEDIPALIAPIEAGRSDVALASRFKDPEFVPEMPRIKKWGNRWMTHLISAISQRCFTDVSCGFRAYNREAALRLNLWGEFTYTHESILEMVVKEMRV
jgi:glycosyltransferase involved in cell wall biosynthesis